MLRKVQGLSLNTDTSNYSTLLNVLIYFIDYASLNPSHLLVLKLPLFFMIYIIFGYPSWNPKSNTLRSSGQVFLYLSLFPQCINVCNTGSVTGIYGDECESPRKVLLYWYIFSLRRHFWKRKSFFEKEKKLYI